MRLIEEDFDCYDIDYGNYAKLHGEVKMAYLDKTFTLILSGKCNIDELEITFNYGTLDEVEYDNEGEFIGAIGYDGTTSSFINDLTYIIHENIKYWVDELVNEYDNDEDDYDEDEY